MSQFLLEKIPQQESLGRSARAEVRDIDESKYTLQADVSTGLVDSYGSIILPSGTNLGLYRTNPVLCWAHPLRECGVFAPAADPERCIGKALDTQITRETDVNRGQVSCVFQYAVDRNPMARTVWDLVVGDYLRMFSIYGHPESMVFQDDHQKLLDGLPAFARDDLKSGAAYYVIDAIEYWEISQVLVGGNPGALKRAVQDGVLSREVGRALVRGAMVDRLPMVVPGWRAPAPAEVVENPTVEKGARHMAKRDADEEGRGMVTCPECGKEFDPDKEDEQGDSRAIGRALQSLVAKVDDLARQVTSLAAPAAPQAPAVESAPAAPTTSTDELSPEARSAYQDFLLEALRK